MPNGDKTIISQPSLEPTAENLPEGMYISLEVLEGPDKGMIFTLTKTRTVLGRGPVDIQLHDPTVSGTHAIIEYTANEVYITDQNSSNGTYVNGQKITRAALANMDELRLGGTKLLFSMVRDVYGAFAAPDEQSLLEEADPNAITDPKIEIPNPELPANVRVLLLVLEGPDAGKKFLLTRQHNTIGRAENADIRLNDPAVSRRHCQVMITAKGQLGIKDLASTNGTFLNGKFISAVKLENNDVIQAGDTKLKVIVL